ncbi:MAG: toxin-antitoxin system HicB family antitoxin [Opitutales bacterium]
MKNLTLKIDETLWKRARHRAVDEGLSVSGWVAELMESALLERESFEEDRREALRDLSQPMHLGGKPFTREELHER